MEKNDRIFIIPSEGATVINPRTGRPIPTDGEEIVKDKYISRRITCGDLKIVNKESKNKN